MPEIIEISGLEDGVGQDPHIPDYASLIAGPLVLVGSLYALSYLIPRLISALRGEDHECDT